MNTKFRENIFVYEDFLSPIKKTSCIENIRVWGSTENATSPPILEIEQN